MKTTLEVLIEAKVLIADEAKWIKGDYCALDDKTRMCVIGAVRMACHGEPRADHSPFEQATCRPATRAISDVIGTFVAPWQDNVIRTHAEVMDAFDRAIAAEQAVLA